MKKLIVDDKIVLIPMTSQLYHIEKNYIADPMMCETHTFIRQRSLKRF